jgi:hypothetical protein
MSRARRAHARHPLQSSESECVTEHPNVRAHTKRRFVTGGDLGWPAAKNARSTPSHHGPPRPQLAGDDLGVLVANVLVQQLFDAAARHGLWQHLRRAPRVTHAASARPIAERRNNARGESSAGMRCHRYGQDGTKGAWRHALTSLAPWSMNASTSSEYASPVMPMMGTVMPCCRSSRVASSPFIWVMRLQGSQCRVKAGRKARATRLACP